MFNPVDTQAGRQADWQRLYRHNIYGLDQQSKMVEKPHYSPTAFNNHTEHGKWQRRGPGNENRTSRPCMALSPMPTAQWSPKREGALNYANDLLHKTKWQVAIWQQQVDAPKTEPPAGKLCNCSRPKARAKTEAEVEAKNPEAVAEAAARGTVHEIRSQVK